MNTFDPLKSDKPLSLEAIPDFQPVEDMRHAQRVEVSSIAWIRNPYGASSAEMISIRLHNLSRFGTGFISTIPYEKGDMLELFLKDDVDSESQRLMVRGSRELPESAYLISAQFCISDQFLESAGVDPRKLDQDIVKRQAS